MASASRLHWSYFCPPTTQSKEENGHQKMSRASPTRAENSRRPKRRKSPLAEAGSPAKSAKQILEATNNGDPIENGSPMPDTQDYAKKGRWPADQEDKKEEAKRREDFAVEARRQEDDLPIADAINSPMRKLRLLVPAWLANTNFEGARQSLLQELMTSSARHKKIRNAMELGTNSHCQVCNFKVVNLVHDNECPRCGDFFSMNFALM